MKYTDTEILDFIIKNVSDKTCDPQAQKVCEDSFRKHVLDGLPEATATRLAVSDGIDLIKARA